LFDRFLWAIGSGALAVFALRLYWLGLYRSYPLLFAFLLFQTVRTAALLPLSRATYALVFIITKPLIWASYVIVLHELFSLVLKGYKGIRTLGRWVLYGGLAVALLLSTIILILSWRGPAEPYPMLKIVMQLERGVVLGLGLLVVIFTAFLALFPVPLNRNIIVHASVYFVYFTTLAGILLTRVMAGPAGNAWFRTVELGVSAGCALAWLFCISRRGEETTWRKPREAPEPARERALLQTLAALNAALLRAGDAPVREAGGWGRRDR
jgi:hypothetical protein